MRVRSLQMILVGSHSRVVRRGVAFQVRRWTAALGVGAVATVTRSTLFDDAIDMQILVYDVFIRIEAVAVAIRTHLVLRMRRRRRIAVTTATRILGIARFLPIGIVGGID